MHTIKEIFTWLDCIMYPMWGISLIDTTGYLISGTILSNTNSIITLLFSITGLVYFIIRIIFYYKKQAIILLVDRENLRKLESENNRQDNINFIFRNDIEGLSKEEYEESKKRLK